MDLIGTIVCIRASSDIFFLLITAVGLVVSLLDDASKVMILPIISFHYLLDPFLISFLYQPFLDESLDHSYLLLFYLVLDVFRNVAIDLDVEVCFDWVTFTAEFLVP